MTKSIKKANIIAAICYLISITSSLIQGTYRLQYALFIIEYAILIALPVTLFTNKRKSFVFAAGAAALWHFYYLIGYSSFHLFSFLAYVCLTVLVTLAIKKNRAARKLWFLPFAFVLTDVIINWFRWGSNFFYIAYTWSTILAQIAEVLALVFAGIWNRDFSLPQAAKDHIPLSNETGYNNTFSAAAGPEGQLNQETSAGAGADKIRMYKELLDSGVITQDEFDAKKKQILGS